jgi:hypothetical protein
MAETNLDRLIEAGAVLDENHISAAHKDALNKDFTKEEIDAIIKMKNQITGKAFASDPGDSDDDTDGMAAL